MNCVNCGHENLETVQFCASCGAALESRAAPTLIGQVVGGRYHIVDRIGEGGMGVVYLAEQTLGSAKRKVAVKTLHPELSRDPSITARFHREVGTVAHLEHPNTVRVYDFGATDDGTLYIAMEYLDGVSLNQVIEKRGALGGEYACNIIRQVAGSLDEAHRQGIIHRDLKPENVLLIERAGEKDVVKLVDFGIAARTESADSEREQKLTQQGMVLGTPPYMSPEQFTGKALDPRSDVYSLGVMSYEMLTGQLPFEADTAWQWATHHMTSPPRSFDDLPSGVTVSAALQSTVLRALSKEPNDRQESAGAFYDDLRASLGDEEAPAAARAAAPALRGTQAMEGPPPAAMAAAVAATEAMPMARGAASTGPAVAAPAGMAMPPAPRSGGGGKGLVYGLSALGAALLVAIGVVAMGGGSDDEVAVTPIELATSGAKSAGLAQDAVLPTSAGEKADPSPTLKAELPAATSPKSTGSSGATQAKSTSKPKAQAKPTAAPRPAAKPTPTVSRPPTSQPAPTPVAAPAPQPSPPVPAPAPTTPAPTTPAPATPATSSAVCDACLDAVRKGDMVAAARAYHGCSNARAKSKCQKLAAQRAPGHARSAALNGDCQKAKAIMLGAGQLGVPASRFSAARQACP